MQQSGRPPPPNQHIAVIQELQICRKRRSFHPLRARSQSRVCVDDGFAHPGQQATFPEPHLPGTDQRREADASGGRAFAQRSSSSSAPFSFTAGAASPSVAARPSHAQNGTSHGSGVAPVRKARRGRKKPLHAKPGQQQFDSMDGNSVSKETAKEAERPTSSEQQSSPAPTSGRVGTPAMASCDQPSCGSARLPQAPAGNLGTPGLPGSHQRWCSSEDREALNRSRQAGNLAFKQGRYKTAEQHYTAALHHLRRGQGDGALLSLAYSNRWRLLVLVFSYRG